MKKIFISIICISMFFSLTVLSFAYYDYSDGPRMSLVIDDADLLDASDEQELCQKLEEISNTYECEIAVLTVNSTNGMDITEFTDDFYDYNGYGFGENDDGLLFAIDMGEREFAISTHGKAIEIFTDYNLDVITNSFTEYLSNADYVTAFSAFLNSCSFILSDYQNYINNLGDSNYTDDDSNMPYDDYYSDFYGDDRYDFSKPERLVRMARKYPELTFIAAHFGGYRCWDDAPLYKGLKNVYFDTCSSLPFISAQRARELIDMLGADRFFFATDFPMWDAEGELERFFSIPMTDSEREMILSGNIKRLLKI